MELKENLQYNGNNQNYLLTINNVDDHEQFPKHKKGANSLCFFPNFKIENQNDTVNTINRNTEYDLYISTLRKNFTQIKKLRKESEEKKIHMRHILRELKDKEKETLIEYHQVRERINRLLSRRLIKNEKEIKLKLKPNGSTAQKIINENLDISKSLNNTNSSTPYSIKKNMSSQNVINRNHISEFSINNKRSNLVNLKSLSNCSLNQMQTQQKEKIKTHSKYNKKCFDNYIYKRKGNLNECQKIKNYIHKRPKRGTKDVYENLKNCKNSNFYEYSKNNISLSSNLFNKEKKTFRDELIEKLKEDEEEKKRVELEIEKVEKEQFQLIHHFSFTNNLIYRKTCTKIGGYLTSKNKAKKE